MNTLSGSFDVVNKFGMPYTSSLATKGFQTLLTSDVAKFNRISPAQPGSLSVDIGNHLDSVELTLTTAWTQFESVYPVQRKSLQQWHRSLEAAKVL